MFPFMVAPAALSSQFESVTDPTELHAFFSRRYQLGMRTAAEGDDLDATAISAGVAAG
jgi:hypothetical protein